MFQAQTLQSLIEEKVPFRHINTGWFTGKCQVCSDYKERAGFRFENGEIVYNCWNCGATGKYEENSGTMRPRFRSILAAYGFDDSEITTIVNSPFFFKKKEDEKQTITLAKLTAVNTTTPTIKLPTKSFKLGHHEEFIDYQQKLVNYLVKRDVDLDKYEFYFSLEEKFLDRVIIPFYRNGKLIYWQARSVNDDEKERYKNAPTPREAIIYGIDKLNTYERTPLFVTEGVFDAMMVDGCSILGSQLNEAKAVLLSQSRRRLVFVIDKDKNGKKFAEDVMRHGWDITFSPEGSEDINHSVSKYGVAWTVYSLMNNIPKNADSARLALSLYCR